jgi:hypothetical protein
MELIDTHYVYLIQEREFIKTGENIYKIGKTTQTRSDRFRQYPKGSNLILHIKCENCHDLERILLNEFSEKFILREDIGKEYFEGDLNEMKKLLIERSLPELSMNSESQSSIYFLFILICLFTYIYYSG